MTGHPVLAGYHLSFPTVQEVRDSLEEIADVLDPRFWQDLVEAAGIRGTESDRACLDRLLAAMKASWDPLIEMAARSFTVRLESYDLLAALARGRGQVPPGRDAPAVPTAPGPITEAARLVEVSRYDLAAEQLRIRLDEITTRTCAELGVPVSLITLVLGNAQVIAGSCGLSGWMAEAGGTPVEWSFCANAVVSGEPYVVPDAEHDLVQRDNPLVRLDGIASYAGVPLISPSGQVLGAHCLIGDRPHPFGPDDVAVLERAAADVLDLLAAVRAADRPTRPPARRPPD